MIHINHFKESRTEKPATWAEAEKFMNEKKLVAMSGSLMVTPHVISINVYPTGPDHNMVLVWDDGELK